MNRTERRPLIRRVANSAKRYDRKTEKLQNKKRVVCAATHLKLGISEPKVRLDGQDEYIGAATFRRTFPNDSQVPGLHRKRRARGVKLVLNLGEFAQVCTPEQARGLTALLPAISDHLFGADQRERLIAST